MLTVSVSGASVCRSPAACSRQINTYLCGVSSHESAHISTGQRRSFRSHRAKRNGRENDDQIDRSGQAIVGLLDQAARSAKEDCDRAFDLAHKLSLQLREAEDRAAQLQAQVDHFQDRALRAESWMVRIYKEIEDKFLSQRAQQEQAARR